MKKNLSYLLALFCLLSMTKAYADVFPMQAEMGGYNPGAYNTTELQNINHYEIDKSYIQSFDTVTKDEQIYDASIEENKNAMLEAIKSVRSGSVTYAVRDTHVDGFDLAKGEIIGLDNKAILAKGSLVNETTEKLIDAMFDDSVMNITLFYGEDIREDEANNLQASLAKKYPDCEVTVANGGQPVYYYLVSLEQL